MTKKLNKRGFTIVELVVVIVVIAILAAVLIPTISSLVNKANQSADTSAVRQMNEQLAITEVEGKPANIGEAIKALLGVNIKLENYTPLATNTQFYWVKSLNRVVYVNIEGGKEEIIYPTDLKDLTHTAGDWYSLNGDIEFKNYSVGTDNSVSIASAGQFAKLVDDINNKQATNISTITLTSDIDLAGATSKFVAQGGNGNTGFQGNLTIDGNSHTIYGLRDDTQTLFGSGDFSERAYGFGLFGNVGSNGKVIIKNVTFDGINVQPTVGNNGTAGLIAGYIYGEVELNKVTFNNCAIVGGVKVAAIVGQLHGKLTMTEVEFTNTTVTGKWEVAKLIGYCTTTGTLTSTSGKYDGITVIASQTGIAASNIGKTGDGTTYGIQGENMWGVATNDWAWRTTSATNTSVTYNNKSYNLHLGEESISENISSES